MAKYEKGFDFLDKDAVYKTFSIDVETNKGLEKHYSQIQVYGDEALRDKIIALLLKDAKNG